MRITSKVTLVLTLMTTVILGTYGYRQVRQAETRLRRTAGDNLRLLGAAVEVAVENAVRDQQVGDVQEILASMDLKDPTIDAFVLDPTGAVSGPVRSQRSLDLARSTSVRVMQRGRPVVRFDTDGHIPTITAVFPLRSDGGATIGTLAFVQPLSKFRRALRSTAATIIASIFTLIVGLSVVVSSLIVFYVRRPLNALVGAMRAVRSGDLGASVDASRQDEIGEVGVEFNAMVRELADTRRQLARTMESRDSLEAGLRRIDKLVTLGQMSAGLAHEIGSPLQVLNGRARALASRADLSADVRRTASILVDQSDRIERIVEQLLHFVRRRPNRWEDVDLPAAARPIFELLETEARRRRVRFGFIQSGPVPTILGDPDKIQQVILNLLRNALQATEPGGEIEFRLAAERTVEVTMTVTDTGPGIDPGKAEAIFEPFFTTRSNEGGTGLGLAVVRAIVIEHGGSIAVDNRNSGGACFTVRLPAATEMRARGLVA